MIKKLLFLLVLLLTATTGAMAQTTYTVAGSNSAMFGSAWDPTNTANDMTKNSDGTYSITYTNVYLDDDVQYKVVKDHSWGEAYPAENRVINIAEAGTYTLTIHFNPTTHEVYETKPGYTVSLADNTKDAGNWSIEPKEGLSEGDQVTIQYNGRMKVKGVKATSDEQAAVLKTPATVTTAPTGATGLTTASAVTEKLVTGGVADGGTLKYAITSTTTQPDDAAFTLTSPTVSDLKTALSMSTLAAGTYYVWYKVFADADHADSEAAYVSVAVAQVITWNSSNVNELRVSGTFEPYTMEGVTLSANGEMNEARWRDDGDESGIRFEAMGSGGFTFTAPTGKAFTKIEMTLVGFAGWDITNLGTGWTYVGDDLNKIYTATWKGSAAASTVGLLTGADMFHGESVKSIAFYLVDVE